MIIRKKDKSKVKTSNKTEQVIEGASSKTNSTGASFESQKKQLVCFNWNKPGHKAVDCRSKPGNSNTWKSQPKTAACQLMSEINSVDSSVCQCKTTSKWPTVAVTSHNGDEYLKDLKYPYKGRAKLNNQNVAYIRDTGSSICIAKEALVELSQYTGETTSVLLADKTVRHLPNAMVSVKIPDYDGLLKVCTMKDPVCDLIIGNDWNERPVQKSDEVEEDYTIDSGTLIFENTKYQEPLCTVKPPVEEYSEVRPIVEKRQEYIVIERDNEVNLEMEEEVIDETFTNLKLCEERAAVQTRSQKRKEAQSMRSLKTTVVNA